jgi:MinD-like ATPase involved in chromosome partitioning or flagellar assembly
MMIYLLTPDPSNKQVKAIEARLHEIVPELRKIKKVEDIAQEINGQNNEKIIVIFVSPSIAAEGIDNLINISRRYRQRSFFILVSNDISATDYKRLIQSGGADWVGASSSLQEIPEIIYKTTTSNRLAEGNVQPDAGPTVISFLPCAGGVGNTTIALEVALQIKRSKASRAWKICYFDLDFQTSHVCDLLDIEARLQITEISDQPERLDEQLFELFVSHHSSGLDVFAAPRSKLDPCEIDVEALDSLMDMISEKYDLIIFDLPVAWYAWTASMIKGSNGIVLTGINTIPCLRQIRTTLDAVLAIKTSSAQTAIAINRVSPRLLGGIKRRQHVEAVLAGEKLFYIQEDPYAVERANTGTPASLGGTGGRVKQFGALASFCAKLRQSASGLVPS